MASDPLTMGPAWLPVYGVSDNEHRLSVLRPTTPHPVPGLRSITLVPTDVDAHVMQIHSALARRSDKVARQVASPCGAHPTADGQLGRYRPNTCAT
jgi:hypothetical protein